MSQLAALLGLIKKADAGFGEMNKNLSKISNSETLKTFSSLTNEIRLFANAASLATDSTQTAAQRMRGLTDMIPVVGSFASALREAGEAISGTTDALRRQALAHHLGTQAIDTHTRALAQMTAARHEASQAEAKASTFSNVKVATPGLDAGLMQNARTFSYAERETGSQFQLDRASRNLQSVTEQMSRATVDEERARKEAEDATGRAGSLEAKRAALTADENSTGARHKAEIDRLGREADMERQRAAGALQRHEDAINRLKQLGLEKSQQESAVRQAAIAKDRERLSILKDQEQYTRAQSQAFGALTKPERQIALQWAKQAQSQGTDSLAPMQLDMIRKAGFGEYVDRVMTERGEGSGELAEMRNVLGEKGDLRGQQKEIVNLEQKIRMEIVVDEEKLATDVAAKVGDSLRSVTAALEKKVESEISRQQGQDIIRRNTQN